MEKKGVLTGLRVLDFGQYTAGPPTPRTPLAARL